MEAQEQQSETNKIVDMVRHDACTEDIKNYMQWLREMIHDYGSARAFFREVMASRFPSTSSFPSSEHREYMKHTLKLRVVTLLNITRSL